MSMIEINESNKSLLEGESKKVIKFYAPWCMPCISITGPMLDRLSNELTDIEFYSVNVDSHTDLAEQFDVMKVPTVIIKGNGHEFKHLGSVKKEDYIGSINSL